MNLLCAEGLPGSEGLNLTAAIGQLDTMADAVEEMTQKHLDRFFANPREFESSNAYFRMLVLVTVLQRDFGVGYNLEWFERPIDFTDSGPIFLHGTLSGAGGSCSSLPVLYAAVGRRLGYPLRLVGAVNHLLVRWDEPNDRLNIEATTRGLNCYPDRHYHTWPSRMRAEDLTGDYYLRSYTPQEELACFLISRAMCRFDWFRFADAMRLAKQACELFPQEPNFQGIHAIATVCHARQKGLARYDNRKQLVVRNGVSRPMTAWESWASDKSDEHLQRLRANHALRSQHDDSATVPSATDAALTSLFT